MPHSASGIAAALQLTLSAKKELSDLGGHLRLSLNHKEAIALRVPSAQMDPIPGMDGIFWMQLPCAYPEAPTCTRLLVGGLSGAICADASVPHGVRLHLLEGALLWWQEKFGKDEAGERIYQRHELGNVWHVDPNEAHGFVVLSDFLCYNTFTPYFPA